MIFIQGLIYFINTMVRLNVSSARLENSAARRCLRVMSVRAKQSKKGAIDFNTLWIPCSHREIIKGVDIIKAIRPLIENREIDLDLLADSVDAI